MMIIAKYYTVIVAKKTGGLYSPGATDPVIHSAAGNMFWAGALAFATYRGKLRQV
jgi:hypothetical protein